MQLSAGGAGVAMIFQEPMTALNPLRTVGNQIGEIFSIHTNLSKADIKTKVLALLASIPGGAFTREHTTAAG